MTDKANGQTDTQNPGVVVGDSVFFRHHQRGACRGIVAAVGKHGCLIDIDDDEGAENRVKWKDILGHHKRAQRHMTVVDQGEDGALMEDQSGQRVFVGGDIQGAMASEPELTKAHTGHEQVLVDIGPLSCGCSNHALEDLHKAMSEGSAGGAWAEHESPFVRELIERISSQGMDHLSDLEAATMKWLSYRSRNRQWRPEPFIPWVPEKAEKIRAYLAGKPRALWTAADYMLLVDYMVHVHLPSSMPETVANMASQQAAVMGRAQAAVGTISSGQAAAILERLKDANELKQAIDASKIDRAIIEYGTAHCAENVTAFRERVRHRLKSSIIEYAKAVQRDGVSPREALQTRMLDKFGEFNQDWRRLAVTETGEMENQGFIASFKPGDRVKRVEQYKGACKFCRSIDGVVATVVATDKPDKDWDTEVWPGKNNVGRSASPYKRVGGQMVPRPENEMWKLPAGLAHPHCRGIWTPVTAPPVDDEFTLWLSEAFKKAPKGSAHDQ